MGWPSLEKIDQRSHTIGEIDARITIEIVQADLTGPIAGQVRRLTKEEVAQETDPIREIETTIAVTVTGHLPSTDQLVFKSLGNHIAAERITDLERSETRRGADRREDLQGLTIAQQPMLGLVAADRDAQSILVKIKPDDKEGVPDTADVTLDMLDDRQQPPQGQGSIGKLRPRSHRIAAAIGHDVAAARETGGIAQVQGGAPGLLGDNIDDQLQDLDVLPLGNPALDDRLGKGHDNPVDKFPPVVIDHPLAEFWFESGHLSAKADLGNTKLLRIKIQGDREADNRLIDVRNH